ncbi:MAG: ral stress protein CsbD, partial [Frankiales bacterium]|nr:ral stress protein CsbD [Frankiales bacterium]
MTGTADEARQGLLASVTGKVKEVAGAVTGNDALAAEGQLQQAEVSARKDAATNEAVAKVEAEQAAAALTETRREADAARDQVDREAAARVTATAVVAEV